MASSEESELSSLELRSKLFHKFQSKGVLQSVKSQLRNRLAFELQGKANGSILQNGKAQSECSFFQQISNSLVLNHLKESKYDYALSVFVTESLTNPDKSIDVKEILHMLHIHSQSKLYNDVVKQFQDSHSNESFLCKFLQLLSAHKSNRSLSISTQTKEDYHAARTSLDAKLKEVELSLKKKLDDKDSDDLETKLLSFQRKYEAQKKTELKAEIERFKSSQLSMMRIEERETYQKEIKKIKEQYEENNRKQMSEFEKKDRDWKDQCERQKQAMEKEAYEKRQKMLTDLQQLKDREMELEKNNELNMKSIIVEEENLKARREQLRYKEEALRDIEKRYEDRLQNEIIRLKYEMQMDGKQHMENLNLQEQQLREDKINFEAQKNVYMQWKKEAEKLKLQNEEQHIALLTSKETITSLNHKVGILTERCNKIANYDEVINLNKLLEKDMALLQKNYDNLNIEKAKREKDHQKLVRDLTKKASRNKEIEIAKDKEGYFREKYYALQDQYQLEVTKNNELKKINEDLLLSQRETLREVDELHSALHFAKQEKQKLHKLPLQASVLRGITSSLKPQKASTFQKRRPLTEDDIINHHHNNKHLSDEEEHATDMLAKLEKEAKDLEQSYKDFKERQKHAYKTTSRVHFDPWVQRRTTSTINSSVGTELTRTLEIGLNDNSFIHNEHHQQPIVTSPASAASTTNNGTLLPLSSTQTPGDSDPAPSFGLSLVPEPSNIRNSARSSIASTDVDFTIKQQRPPTVTTCYSLTQHPLADATDNQTNTNQSSYGMYDTRNTLTQYPLGDTELNTVLEKPTEEEEGKEDDDDDDGDEKDDNEIEMQRKSSSISEVSTFKSNHSIRRDTNSVEGDFQLKETSIETFESPEKCVNEQVSSKEDIFYTPAKGVTIGLEDISSARSGKSSIITSSKDGGSLRENDLRTDSISIEVSLKGSTVNEGTEGVDEKEEKEGEKEENNDMMAKYMQMVLQKKQDEKDGTVESAKNEVKSDDQFDIPISEDENKIVISDNDDSEFEW